jgi:hypothetical protein
MIYMAGIGDLLERKTWWIDGSVGCNKCRKEFKPRRISSGEATKRKAAIFSRPLPFH